MHCHAGKSVFYIILGFKLYVKIIFHSFKSLFSEFIFSMNIVIWKLHIKNDAFIKGTDDLFTQSLNGNRTGSLTKLAHIILCASFHTIFSKLLESFGSGAD